MINIFRYVTFYLRMYTRKLLIILILYDITPARLLIQAFSDYSVEFRYLFL